MGGETKKWLTVTVSHIESQRRQLTAVDRDGVSQHRHDHRDHVSRLMTEKFLNFIAPGVCISSRPDPSGTQKSIIILCSARMPSDG